MGINLDKPTYFVVSQTVVVTGVMKSMEAAAVIALTCDFGPRPAVVTVEAEARRGQRMSIGDFLFGCCHKRTSFPRTTKARGDRHGVIEQAGTYVVCLDCGKEFGYDWQEMRRLDPLKKMREGTGWTKAASRRSTPVVSLILAMTGLAHDKKEAA